MKGNIVVRESKNRIKNLFYRLQAKTTLLAQILIGPGVAIAMMLVLALAGWWAMSLQKASLEKVAVEQFARY